MLRNWCLFTSHFIMDALEGRFVKNIFTGEVKFKYDLTPVEADQIYQLVEILGEKYAGYIFDYLLPGSLRPLRTVRASFPAYGSGTFQALFRHSRRKGNPAVVIRFFYHKCSKLFTFFC